MILCPDDVIWTKNLVARHNFVAGMQLEETLDREKFEMLIKFGR
jgi:hypothetical protein